MAMISTAELKEIADMANIVPTEYRQKCFELLLANRLASDGAPTPDLPQKSIQSNPNINNLVLPIDVKAFFNQYRLELGMLSRLFHLEGGEVRPIYRLNENTKVKAELNHALLMALENALRSGQFQVEVELLRNRCQEQKCYDMANFMRHLRKNARLFRGVTSDQPLVLAAEGKSLLATLLRRMEISGIG
ncbi:MAG: hypothetical protein PHQ40_07475 [Anaerolineaceae bacterium]|nr:hypothetical protein [Anaerolineaceae bacterium]